MVAAVLVVGGVRAMTDPIQHLRDLLAQAYPDAPISLAEQRKVQRRLFICAINNLPTLLAIAEAAREAVKENELTKLNNGGYGGADLSDLENALAKLEKP